MKVHRKSFKHTDRRKTASPIKVLLFYWKKTTKKNNNCILIICHSQLSNDKQLWPLHSHRVLVKVLDENNIP